MNNCNNASKPTDAMVYFCRQMNAVLRKSQYRPAVRIFFLFKKYPSFNEMPFQTPPYGLIPEKDTAAVLADVPGAVLPKRCMQKRVVVVPVGHTYGNPLFHQGNFTR